MSHSNEKILVGRSLVSSPRISRFFGRTLFVNLGSAEGSSCTWHCVYCPKESGDGASKSAGGGDAERLEAGADAKQVIAAIQNVVAGSSELDSIVFTSTTEPTHHPMFAEIVGMTRDLRLLLGASWLLQSIGPGPQLDEKKALEAYRLLDRFWVKLDCAIGELFESALKPGERESLEKYVAKLRALGPLYLRVTFWRDLVNKDRQNWTPENLEKLLALLVSLKPRRVHLATLKNVAPTSNLRPVGDEDLDTFALRLHEAGVDAEVFA
ncbi:hypothetical protein WDW86_09125 [Bdellovibrionota bacterium FG-2]